MVVFFLLLLLLICCTWLDFYFSSPNFWTFSRAWRKPFRYPPRSKGKKHGQNYIIFNKNIHKRTRLLRWEIDKAAKRSFCQFFPSVTVCSGSAPMKHNTVLSRHITVLVLRHLLCPSFKKMVIFRSRGLRLLSTSHSDGKTLLQVAQQSKTKQGEIII